MKKYVYIGFLVVAAFSLKGQSNTSSAHNSAGELEVAIKNNDEKAMADAYFKLGIEFFDNANYASSLEYLEKAKKLYQKLELKSQLSKTARKIAQINEVLNQKDKAISNYKIAENNASNPNETQLNSNDIQRLNSNNPALETQNIYRNIELNNQNPTEVSQGYKQLAVVNLKQNNVPEATSHLQHSYNIDKVNNPQQALLTSTQLADVYVKNHQIPEAIKIKEKVLKEKFLENNSENKVAQIQELAQLYGKNKEGDKAEKLLKQALSISLQKGHTLQAQQSLQQLDSLYGLEKNTQASLVLYRNFLEQLPDLISKDQSLVDQKIWQETEARIQVLENEKHLNDLLILQKNRMNYILIGSFVLLLGWFVYLWYSRKKLQTQNKKIALQSLRREMNPHFIFNSLNSINQYIAQNNEREANQYLTKFSALMRNVLDNSGKDFIPITEEIQLIENYLALEHKRFQNQFQYTLKIDPELQHSEIQIPVMLVQPFIENAVWHGLRYRKEEGLLQVQFKKKEKTIEIQITDNGIGIEKSKSQKTPHQNQHKGIGMKNSLMRIKYLNDLYHKNIRFRVEERQPGVQVTLQYEY